MPLIPNLRRLRQGDHEITASLAYIISLRSDYTLCQDSVKGRKEKKKGRKKGRERRGKGGRLKRHTTPPHPLDDSFSHIPFIISGGQDEN